MHIWGKTSAIAVAVLIAFGCSNDPDPETDAGMMMSDGGTDAGTDRQDATSETDTSDPEPDAQDVTNPETCDPIAQDCVEDAASKCEARYEEMMFSYTCGEDGTASLLESCERPNGIPGEDTCAAGLWCSGFGQPNSEDRVCLEFCSAEAPCEDQAKTCLSLTASQPYGTCVESCDPLDDQCADGTKCGSYYTNVGEQNIWVCDLDSGAEPGTPCMWASDCGAGQSCSRLDNQDENVCNVVCGDDSDCPGDSYCRVGPTLQGVGYCLTPDWSCVGSVTVPEPTLPEVAVDVFVLSDYVMSNTGAVEGATVKVCAADDIECANPLATDATDANGLTTVNVPTGTAGFDGYFEVSADGWSTSLGYSSLPIAEAPMSPVIVQLLPADVEPLWSGVTVDPARGSVTAVVLACVGPDSPPVFGGRVSVSSSNADASTVTGYRPDTLEPTVYDQQLTGTTAAGALGMVNHPVGTTDLTFTKADGVAVARRSVIVRASTVTSLDVLPTE